MKLFALYVSVARHGVTDITMHHTEAEAYATLAEFIQTCAGNEDTEDEDEDDSIPDGLDDLMAWCEARAEGEDVEFYCTEVGFHVPVVVSPDPDENWANDAIQLPRLLAELEAILRPDDYVEVAAAMDLPVARVHELMTRAQAAWDAAKEKTR